MQTVAAKEGAERAANPRLYAYHREFDLHILSSEQASF
jgi:hypothetical protein